MMQIVPLDRLLLAALVEYERDPLTAEMASGGFVDVAMRAASHGHAFALLDGGWPVVGMGLTHHWNGLAEAWALVSREARPRHIVLAVQQARRFLDKRQRDPALRRVEMFVRAQACWSESFAAALGFVCEGHLRRRDPLGRDYKLFARVREAC